MARSPGRGELRWAVYLASGLAACEVTVNEVSTEAAARADAGTEDGSVSDAVLWDAGLGGAGWPDAGPDDAGMAAEQGDAGEFVGDGGRFFTVLDGGIPADFVVRAFATGAKDLWALASSFDAPNSPNRLYRFGPAGDVSQVDLAPFFDGGEFWCDQLASGGKDEVMISCSPAQGNLIALFLWDGQTWTAAADDVEEPYVRYAASFTLPNWDWYYYYPSSNGNGALSIAGGRVAEVALKAVGFDPYALGTSPPGAAGGRLIFQTSDMVVPVSGVCQLEVAASQDGFHFQSYSVVTSHSSCNSFNFAPLAVDPTASEHFVGLLQDRSVAVVSCWLEDGGSARCDDLCAAADWDVYSTTSLFDARGNLWAALSTATSKSLVEVPRAAIQSTPAGGYDCANFAVSGLGIDAGGGWIGAIGAHPNGAIYLSTSAGIVVIPPN